MPTKKQNVPAKKQTIDTRQHRGNKYAKFFHRFYETLFLLHSLSRTQAPRSSIHCDIKRLSDLRRRFHLNLAIACDNDKGGPSTTALAVQDREDALVYWIAANGDSQGGISPEVAAHLEGLIRDLANIVGLPQTAEAREGLERAFVEKFINFKSPKVKKENMRLSNAAERCIKYLSTGMESEASDNYVNVVGARGVSVVEWLRKFDKSHNARPATQLCSLAYSERHKPEMNELKAIITRLETCPDVAKAFHIVYHTVGRLASHVRTPRQLIRDATDLQERTGGTSHLDPVRVERVPRPPSVPRPKADERTTALDSLRRMVRAEDERFERLSGNLQVMGPQLYLDKGMQEFFDDEAGPPPSVHAEVQVLDHFYQQKLTYVYGDAVIVCSKPACLCCKLYFHHHPAGVEEPPTHGTVYPRWGPACSPDAPNGAQWLEQRGVLQHMIEDMRKLVLVRLRDMLGPLPYRTDSLTAITEKEELPYWSENSMSEDMSAAETDSESGNGRRHVELRSPVSSTTRPSLTDTGPPSRVSSTNHAAAKRASHPPASRRVKGQRNPSRLTREDVKWLSDEESDGGVGL